MNTQMAHDLMVWLSQPLALAAVFPFAGTAEASSEPAYEYRETRDLVELVNQAAELIGTKGEAALPGFRIPGSRWKHAESYVFVLDPQGNMLVHPDPALEGKNQLELKDIDGRTIVRGLIDVATTLPDKPEGWYHYQWPVPGQILPRWKSSYVRLVSAPSGKAYIVGSGMYNDRMERSFVVDAVKEAVGWIEKYGAGAFPLFRDPAGLFIAKDSYIFVYDSEGVNLVLPPFRNLEGQKLLDVKDTQGKPFIRQMLAVVESRGSGWVHYMWPRPGESISTQKSAFVSKAKVGDGWVMVGCGVYLADAPRVEEAAGNMTGAELMTLVRDGAELLEIKGEKAYPEFRTKGSRWFRNDTYFFVWAMGGTVSFDAAEPANEGRDSRALKDIVGRPFGRMAIEAAGSPSGEGWVHSMYPKPGSLFPTWRSIFVKRVAFPSGQQYLVGSGIFDMRMDAALTEDTVHRAADLIAVQGKAAFPQLRDRTGPFFFMNTYLFVFAPDGTELVNAGQPSFEGTNMMALQDVRGHYFAKEAIAAAMKEGKAWVEYFWYKPGQNTPVRKRAFFRRVRSGEETYIVGSGLYVED